VTQTLFSASLIAEALPTAFKSNPEEGLDLLSELRQLNRGALAEMRALLMELRPSALEEANLEDLLRQLGEAAAGREGIPVKVQTNGHCDLPPDVHIALYRITQEALNNALKHARAKQISIKLATTFPVTNNFKTEIRHGVQLTICDDGRGFDPSNIPSDHLGLNIMRERALSIGANLTIDSKEGKGTQVTVLWENTYYN
jgi:signal transduction histidine kinase